jgi:hypothetical protein
MIVNPILNKKQNYRLWQAGDFGNKLRAWRSVEEWCNSGYQGNLTMRVLLLTGSGLCLYNVPPAEVDQHVREWNAQGIPTHAIMLNESAPNHLAILQGEYLNDVVFDYNDRVHAGCLWASRASLPMRDALADHDSVELSFGLRADLLLQFKMTPASYENWKALLEQYPGHVFEVSIFDCCVGDLPYQNALVWEVRKY